MNSLLNFSKHFAIPAAIVFAAHFSATAQSPVESTHIDEKYAYTTVVYKNKAANDQEVLTMLESDFSIGDVVRVTLAPPPAPPSAPIAASEPVYADKSKGEDTWMPSIENTSATLTAAADMLPNTSKSIVVETVALPISAATISSKPTTTPTRNTAQFQTIENAQVVQATPAVNKTANTMAKSSKTKAGKTAKADKSSRKKFATPKFKPRKKGKQGYACPKF